MAIVSSTAAIVVNDLVLATGGKCKSVTPGAATGEVMTYDQLPYSPIIQQGWTTNGASGSQRFPGPNNSAALSATETTCQLPCLAAGKIGFLVCNMPTAFATAASCVVVARINGVNATPTGTATSGTTGLVASDSAHFPSVAQGDLVSIGLTFNISDSGTSNGKVAIGFKQNT